MHVALGPHCRHPKTPFIMARLIIQLSCLDGKAGADGTDPDQTASNMLDME